MIIIHKVLSFGKSPKNLKFRITGILAISITSEKLDNHVLKHNLHGMKIRNIHTHSSMAMIHKIKDGIIKTIHKTPQKSDFSPKSNTVSFPIPLRHPPNVNITTNQNRINESAIKTVIAITG